MALEARVPGGAEESREVGIQEGRRLSPRRAPRTNRATERPPAAAGSLFRGGREEDSWRRALLQFARDAGRVLRLESGWRGEGAAETVLFALDRLLSATGLSIVPKDESEAVGPLAACTIISKNYLSLVRVWNDSIRRHHPGCRTFVLIVDRIEGAFDPAGESFEVIEVEDLGIPDFRDLAFKYNILELNTAVKPFLLEFLLLRKNLDRLVYLDPDVVLFSPIRKVVQALAEENIVLVPHILSPMAEDGKLPNETDFLISGSYNLGFIGVRSSPTTFQFLNWWKSRLLNYGFSAPQRGLFTDQKWIDLAPSLFARVAVVRDRGYNTAYWNLPERLDLEETPGGFRFPEAPLTFYHFSGLEFDRPERVSKYQNRFRLSHLNSAYRRLFTTYVEQVRRAGFEETRSLPYAYAHFDDGTRISGFVRQLYHSEGEGRARWADPFCTSGKGTFREWLLQPSALGSRLPRFLRELYRARTDLQAAFPNPETSDTRALLEWAVQSVEREHDLNGFFLDELRRRIAEMDRQSRDEAAGITPPSSPAAKSDVPTEPPRVDRGGPGEADRAGRSGADVPRIRSIARHVSERLREMESHPSYAGSPTTVKGRLLLALLGSKTFRRLRALAWVLRDLGSDAQVAVPGEGPARSMGKRLIERLLGRRRYRFLRRIVWTMRVWSRPEAPAMLASGSSQSAASGTRLASVARARYPFGVNLFGYFDTESGVGEIARSMARMLRSEDIPHVLINVEQRWLRRKDFTFRDFSSSNPYAMNLFVVNADMVPTVLPSFGRSALDRPHNIGYWFWELSRFPDRFQSSFRFLSEIWVASSFCLESVSSSSPIPVVKVPPGFDFQVPGKRSRHSFGIAEDDLVFLYAFDGASSFYRKNPGGVISAFRRAFPEPGCERLILKIANAPAEKVAALRRLAGGSRVEIIADYLNREDLLDLIAASDCYVSLHRSEGFGLTILESMAMGKPVIATDYSGSEDFLHRGNGFPVGYRLVRICRTVGPYGRGQIWAQPDLDEAARFMRRVGEEPDVTARLGQAAQADVGDRWTLKAAGHRVRDRLERLGSSHPAVAG